MHAAPYTVKAWSKLKTHVDSSGVSGGGNAARAAHNLSRKAEEKNDVMDNDNYHKIKTQVPTILQEVRLLAGLEFRNW